MHPAEWEGAMHGLADYRTQYRRRQTIWQASATALRLAAGITLSVHPAMWIFARALNFGGLSEMLACGAVLAMSVAIVLGTRARLLLIVVVFTTALVGMFPDLSPSLIDTLPASHLRAWLTLAVLAILAGDGWCVVAPSPIVGSGGMPGTSLFKYPLRVTSSKDGPS
jgi:hypothetical protein